MSKAATVAARLKLLSQYFLKRLRKTTTILKQDRMLLERRSDKYPSNTSVQRLGWLGVRLRCAGYTTGSLAAKGPDNGALCVVISNVFIFLNGCPARDLIANLKHGVLKPVTNRLIVSLHITSRPSRDAPALNKSTLISVLQNK
jgi:hypothetical protein